MSFIKNISDGATRAYFKKYFSGYGGGSGGGASTGVVAVAYHPGGDYLTGEIEGTTLYRISDATPTYTEIDEAILLLSDTDGSIPIFEYGGIKLVAQSDENEFIPLGPANTNVSINVSFLIVREEGAAAFGLPSPGIWMVFNGVDERDVWLIWEP